MVENKTGSRIPIRRTFVFPNRNSYISAVGYKYEIWFGDRYGPSEESDATKSKTGSQNCAAAATKPESYILVVD